MRHADLRDADRQGFEAAQHDGAAECRAIGEQAYRGETFQQHLEGDTAFQTRQERPETVMDAAAERNMAAFAAVDVELVRLVEHRRVVIGRTDEQDDTLAALHREAVHLAILHRGAEVRLHR